MRLIMSSTSVNHHASTSRSPDLSRTLPIPGSSRTFSVQLSRSPQLEYSSRCNAHSPLVAPTHAQNDVNRELIVMSLDSTVSRQPTLQPARDPTFNTFPLPAISYKPNTYYSHHHVPDEEHLLIRPSISHRPNLSSTPGHHVSSYSHLESYLSSSSHRNVAINSNSERQTTSTPVFNNISDLASHYGIPQFLPRAPRTTPHRSESGESSSSISPVEPFTSTSSDFADLCSNYLTMLSQKPNDNDASDVHVEDTAPLTASPSDADAIKTLMDVFGATPELTMSNDLNEYLTSPLIDSPFDDELLTTPAFGSADLNADVLTSPLLDDFGGDSYGELPSLFNDFGSMYPPSKTPESHNPLLPNLDQMYHISPETPMFDTPSTSHLDTPAYHPPQRKPNVNGTRKNITPESLVPIDAPTQQRNYLTPSATSRKAVPAVFARKRARTAAFGEEQDELEDVQITPSMTEHEQIEAKRRQNTIAARRSRKRKLEYQRELEESVEQYKRESEIWKARAMTCQALLRSHTIECPEFPDP